MKNVLSCFFKSVLLVYTMVIAVCLLCMPLNSLIKDFKSETEQTKAYSEALVYAKAKDNCHLFKTSDVSDCSYRNVIFIVPSSYFVSILQEVNSYIYRVQYLNKIGYVSADTITKVNFVPTTISLQNITFDITESVGTQIRSSPVAEGVDNILSVVPAGSLNLNYIASVEGDIPTGGSSKYWYFATYSPESDPTSVYEGYVYSEKAINLTIIPINSENIEEIPNQSTPDQNVTSFSLNNVIKVVLIVLICIPIVLVFILMVVSNRKNKEGDLNDVEQAIPFVQEQPKDVRHKFKKVNELKGVSLTKKRSPYDKFITTKTESKADCSLPSFPTYEIVDDDDLL